MNLKELLVKQDTDTDTRSLSDTGLVENCIICESQNFSCSGYINWNEGKRDFIDLYPLNTCVERVSATVYGNDCGRVPFLFYSMETSWVHPQDSIVVVAALIAANKQLPETLTHLGIMLADRIQSKCWGQGQGYAFIE